MYLLVLSTVNFQNGTKKVYHFARENFHTRLTRNNILRRFDSNVGIISVKKIYYKTRAHALQWTLPTLHHCTQYQNAENKEKEDGEDKIRFIVG